MPELTREKKCQIAALGAKGKNAEEIAEIAKVEIEAVKALLATRDTDKIAEPPKEDISAMNRTELKAYAVRLYNQGKKHKEIMEITGLSRSVLYTLIPVGKDSYLTICGCSLTARVLSEHQSTLKPYFVSLKHICPKILKGIAYPSAI